jgi:hypothetical protein
MKKTYSFKAILVLFFLSIIQISYSQSVTLTPNGALIPSFTSTNRVALTATDGQLVYDTDTKSFWYMKDATWTEISAASGDNLGNHTATQNLNIGSNYITYSGGNHGLYYNGLNQLSLKGGTSGSGSITIFNIGDATNEYSDLYFKNLNRDWRLAAHDTKFLVNDFTNGNNPIVIEGGSGSDRLYIKGNFVGIGNSNPETELHVSGTTKSNSIMLTSGACNGCLLQSNSEGFGTWVNSNLFYDNLGNHTATQTLNLNDNFLSNDGSANGLKLNSSFGGVLTGSNSTNFLTIGNSNNTTAYLNLHTNLKEYRIISNGNLLSFYDASLNKTPFVIDNANTDNLLYLKDDKVGIGTSAPTESLDVNGKIRTTTFQMTDGASSGRILQSDGSGNGSWVAPSTLFSSNWTTSGTNQYSSLSGNVGIGVTSPSEKLEVSGKTKTTNLQMTNGATSGYLLTSDASGNGTWTTPSTTITAGTGLSYSGSTLNTVWTTSGNNIYKNNSANVGIGTSSPTALLDVYIENTGTADQSSTTSGSSASNSIVSSSYQTFTAGASGYLSKVALYFSGSGDARTVTIYQGSGTGGTALGTSASVTPNAGGTTDFTFSGINITSGSVYTISISNQANWRYSSSNIYSGGASSNIGDYLFVTYISPYVGNYNLVTSNAGVGIGTTSPTERLEVSGKTKTTTFQMTNGASLGYILQSDASGNGSWVANNSSVVAGTGLSYSGTTLNSVWTTSSNSIYNNNTEYVGIGTGSPSRRLHVDASTNQFVAQFDGSNAVGTWLSLKNATSGADTWNMVSTGSGNGEGAGHFLWNHGTNGTKMILNSTGSLGIGTTTPKSVLDVSGAVGFKISTQSSTGSSPITLDNSATVWYFTGTSPITLPTASSCANRIYKIVNRNGSNRTISSFTNLSGTATTSILANSSIEIISDGTNWLQIN